MAVLLLLLLSTISGRSDRLNDKRLVPRIPEPASTAPQIRMHSRLLGPEPRGGCRPAGS